jgi:hypothetical protein
MALILDGTNGLSDVDGSASTPAVRGTDTNTGIFFPAADTIAFAEGGAEVARFNSSGDLGVGTSSPQAKLDVNGNIHARGASFPAFKFADSSGNAEAEIYYGISSNDLNIVSNQSGGQIVFNANGAERFRINADGNLSAIGIFNNTTASGANVHISSGGGGQLFRSTSSIKYKTDVQDATHGLTDVLKLRPVTYKGINDGDTVFGGLIAEEVHEAGLSEFVQYAEDGSPDALAYANMVSLCIKAIQEQQAIITDLKSRIEALEAK